MTQTQAGLPVSLHPSDSVLIKFDQLGNMSVIKRGNSKFWYIQFQLNGKTFIRSARTTSKKAAEQMEAEWRTALHANRFLGEKERITVRNAFKQFCES